MSSKGIRTWSLACGTRGEWYLAEEIRSLGKCPGGDIGTSASSYFVPPSQHEVKQPPSQASATGVYAATDEGNRAE